MNSITVKKNWCEIDQLDGVDLSKNEKINVNWPDGTTTVEIVQIDDRSYMGSDMGHPAHIIVQKAFIYVVSRGVQCKFYLDQVGILCERTQ